MLANFVLFSATLAALARASGFAVIPNACQNTHTLKLNSLDLFARQGITCSTGFVVCQTGCIPTGTSCCDNGGFCKTGLYCDSDGGCCPTGQTCSGISAGCTGTDQPCGNKCMPGGSVCCPNGTYCNAGTSCSGETCVTNTGNSTTTCPTNQIYCVNNCIDATRTCCGTQGYSCPPNYRCDSLGGCQPLNSVDCGNGHYCNTGSACTNVTSDSAQCSAINAPSASAANPNFSNLFGSATLPAQSTTSSAAAASVTSQSSTSTSRSFAPVATSVLNPGSSGAANSRDFGKAYNFGFVAGLIGLFL